MLKRRHAVGNGTTGGDQYLRPNLFRLGSYAHGRLTMTASRSGGRYERVCWITWDGTNLYMHTLSSRGSGVIDIGVDNMSNGVLVASIFAGASGVAVNYAVEFDGISIEDATSYTGDVTRTVQANTTDIKDTLVRAGLVLDDGATPLNLDGGALTAGRPA